MPSSYDTVVVGAGHNGLTAAAYLARAGRSVLVLERAGHVGGAAVSGRPFAGIDARVSRFSYLVSLLPEKVVADLGLDVRLAQRRIASYTPVGDGGLLLRSDHDWGAWGERFGRFARRVFPTLTEPLRSREEMRALAGDDETWRDVAEAPIGEAIERAFPADDVLQGVVLTDALIGTFSHAHDPSLLQNRCLLYHVVGRGTGEWQVPVGGMGAVTAALREAALAAGAEIVTGAAVTRVDPGEVAWEDEHGAEHAVGAGHVLAAVAPAELDRLRGRTPSAPKPEGAQLKVNLLVERLPRLRDRAVSPEDAFAGTFHVAEGYGALQRAYEQAARGELPADPPSELYCHTLTDATILAPELRDRGWQTLTLFGLHMPARLFEADPEGAREAATRATLRTLDEHLAEPIEDVVARDADGRPCIEIATPHDLERELRLPGGHIFHRDLSWPWAEAEEEVGRWGVETDDPRILLSGAGARRGGGVSGIPGHNAAMAVLGAA